MYRSVSLILAALALVLLVLGTSSEAQAASITVQSGRLGFGYDPTRWFVQVRCDDFGWGYRQGWIPSPMGWTFNGFRRNARVWIQVVDSYAPWGSRLQVKWVTIGSDSAAYRLSFFPYD
jgi:hypothetical protein